MVIDNDLQSSGVLHYLKLQEHDGKTKFGMLIEKFTDRILSDIMLQCVNDIKLSSRKEYIFKNVTNNNIMSLNTFAKSYFDEIKDKNQQK